MLQKTSVPFIQDRARTLNVIISTHITMDIVNEALFARNYKYYPLEHTVSSFLIDQVNESQRKPSASVL